MAALNAIGRGPLVNFRRSLRAFLAFRTTVPTENSLLTRIRALDRQLKLFIRKWNSCSNVVKLDMIQKSNKGFSWLEDNHLYLSRINKLVNLFTAHVFPAGGGLVQRNNLYVWIESSSSESSFETESEDLPED